jgi:hypothetical protein
MLRRLTGLGVAVLLLVGTAQAQTNQNPQQNQPGARGQAQGQAQGQAGARDYMQGKIVRVDPTKGTLVIRTNTGQEREFRTGDKTQYFGTDRQALKEGLRSRDLRQGANVMWRAEGNNISELRLGTTQPGGTPNPGGTTNPGSRPGGTTTPPGGTTNPGTRPGGTGGTTPPPR